MQCLKCKGRNLCGRSYCPHILRNNTVSRVREKLSESFSGSSPAPFVGWHGYPEVNVGILSPPEPTTDAWMYDAPRYWAKEDYQIPKLVDFRSSLINSRFKSNVRKQSRLLELGQEVGMASKPVDVEIDLKAKPEFHLSTSDQLAPMGPRGLLQKAKITSNPKVHTKVDRVVSDNHLKATEALNYLYKNKFDENFLTRIFSIGNLGLKKNRKLVPTRWSITAVDDTISKKLREKVTDHKMINDHMAYFGNYLGNYYLVLMLPEVWSYELFETYMPKASWNPNARIAFMTDFESFNGRSNYADNCQGGYYSVRLAVLEKLKQMKKQATCLVIRVITGDYSAPMGVWVTREAARKSLTNEPIKFSSMELMIKYAKAVLKKKFGINADILLNKSRIMKNQNQTKLGSYY